MFTVHICEDTLSFLSALASKNVFVIKLVKMWAGKTPDVVVGTLKISLDRLFFKENGCRWTNQLVLP